MSLKTGHHRRKRNCGNAVQNGNGEITILRETVTRRTIENYRVL